MLLVPTFLSDSRFHGKGCFSARHLEEGATVWAFEGAVDHVLDWRTATQWEKEHAYGSLRLKTVILPRDNAAFLNFSHDPNLKEGELVNGEATLVAIRRILQGEELTVPLESDTDADWKMSFVKKA